MDFGILPPEINSGRMYSGPGSTPMMAAATAWDRLAAELGSASAAYPSLIAELTTGWQGPASAAMAAAAAPYMAWLATTAGQASQAATQAKAAAGAYEAAFVMTVPPPVIAANRTQLMSLVATNVLGQNTPAIATTEAHYGEMWAQDAAAMYGYAANSAAAAQVTPFTTPPQNTNPAGLAGQAAAVAHAVGTSAGTHAQVTQLISAMPQALQSLAAPAISTPLDPLQSLLAYIAPFITVFETAPILPTTLALSATSLGVALSNKQQSPDQKCWPRDQATPEPQPPESKNTLVSRSPGGTEVSARVGRATMVGELAVPRAWSAGAIPGNLVAAALRQASLSAAPAVSASGPADMVGGIPIPFGGLPGRGGSGAGANAEKSDGPSDYRTAIAKALGRPAAEAKAGHPGDDQLLERVAELYPGTYALLNALGHGNERSGGTSLAKVEREILALVRRLTTGD